MSFRFDVSKRGEKWSCCRAWQHGATCACLPWLVEFTVNDKTQRLFKEGPRPSDLTPKDQAKP